MASGVLDDRGEQLRLQIAPGSHVRSEFTAGRAHLAHAHFSQDRMSLRNGHRRN